MRKAELEELRLLVRKEINRRVQINNLLKVKEVLEYLSLNNIEPNYIDYHNIDEIIKYVMSSYDYSKITITNGIYVCTSAFDIDSKITYQDTSFYRRNVPINSKDAEYKTYTDIESGNTIKAGREDMNKEIITKEFEKENIVLNPYNSSDNMNGYNEVKDEFFINAIRQSQTKSKNLILKKYERL